MTAPRRKKRRTRWVEHQAYGEMCARMIRAYGRRVAGADMVDFAQLVALRDVVNEAISEAVPGLRHDGYSWASIGEAVGMTKQAAQQKWGRSSRTSRLDRATKSGPRPLPGQTSIDVPGESTPG